jgi:hypothetical protein
LALVGIVVLGAVVAGCCAGVGCLPEMNFVVHVASDRAGLEGSTVTVCRDGLCMSGTPTWINVTDPAGWENAGIGFAGAINGEGSIDVSPDGRARLELSAWVANDAARDGDLLVHLCRGHRRGVAIVGERPHLHRPLPALGGHLQDPRARSRRRCGGGHGRRCVPERDCVRATWPGSFKGAISASLFGGRKGVGKPFVFRVYVYDDPAVLADGDHYTVTVMDQSQSVLAAVDQQVTYDETFPDGPACDAFPTRTVTLGN